MKAYKEVKLLAYFTQPRPKRTELPASRTGLFTAGKRFPVRTEQEARLASEPV
jgi:hypothetical protein